MLSGRIGAWPMIKGDVSTMDSCVSYVNRLMPRPSFTQPRVIIGIMEYLIAILDGQTSEIFQRSPRVSETLRTSKNYPLYF